MEYALIIVVRVLVTCILFHNEWLMKFTFLLKHDIKYYFACLDVLRLIIYVCEQKDTS